MNNSKLVFSTETGSHRKTDDQDQKWTKTNGPLKMRLETAGRGGKAVTVLFQLPWDEIEAKNILKAMQSSFGCGGSIKESTIELRGDVRTKVETFLSKKNIKIVRAGG